VWVGWRSQDGRNGVAGSTAVRTGSSYRATGEAGHPGCGSPGCLLPTGRPLSPRRSGVGRGTSAVGRDGLQAHRPHGEPRVSGGPIRVGNGPDPGVAFTEDKVRGGWPTRYRGTARSRGSQPATAARVSGDVPAVPGATARRRRASGGCGVVCHRRDGGDVVSLDPRFRGLVAFRGRSTSGSTRMLVVTAAQTRSGWPIRADTRHRLLEDRHHPAGARHGIDSGRPRARPSVFYSACAGADGRRAFWVANARGTARRPMIDRVSKGRRGHKIRAPPKPAAGPGRLGGLAST
jgi:hypothetical protein